MSNETKLIKSEVYDYCLNKENCYKERINRLDDRIEKIHNENFLQKFGYGFARLEEPVMMIFMLLAFSFYLIFAFGGYFNKPVHILIVPFLMFILILIGSLGENENVKKKKIKKLNDEIECVEDKIKAYEDLKKKIVEDDNSLSFLNDPLLPKSIVEKFKKSN